MKDNEIKELKTLSNINDKFEKREESLNESIAKDILDEFSNEIGFDIRKVIPDIYDTEFTKFQFIKYGVLDTSQYAKFLEIATKHGFSMEYYIHCAISLYCLDKQNKYYIIDLLKNTNIIESFEEDENEDVLITSKYCEPIKFSRADNTFKSEEIKDYIKSDKARGGCHENSLFLMKKYPEYKAMTVFCKGCFGRNYYHSFNFDEKDNVVDLNINVRMSKDDYYRLYKPIELSLVDSSSFDKENKEASNYDNDEGFNKLLKIAMYKQHIEKDQTDLDI